MEPNSIMALTDGEFRDEFEDFVVGVAVKLRQGLRLKVELDDLVAYGYLGLLQARTRYIDGSKATFKSFAYYRVRGAMLDGCRSEGWMSRSRSVSIKSVSSANGYLESHAQANSDAPPSRSLDEAVSRVGDLAADVLTIMFVEDESDFDQVTAPRGGGQVEAVERSERSTTLKAAIAELDDREREIIERHHFGEDTITQIAKDLGFNKSWVSRIHARAITKLRRILLDAGYDPD